MPLPGRLDNIEHRVLEPPYVNRTWPNADECRHLKKSITGGKPACRLEQDAAGFERGGRMERDVKP